MPLGKDPIVEWMDMVNEACVGLESQGLKSESEMERLKIGRESTEAMALEGFPKELQPKHLKWVTRFDIVNGEKLTDTGVHGEAYIIRFLAIKMHRIEEITKQAKDFDRLPDDAETDTIETDFKAKYAGNLAMASSQGACSSCAKFMDKLGIAYASTQDRNTDRAGTWMHPFTLTTEDKSFGRNANSKLWLSSKVRSVNEGIAEKLPKDV